MLLWVRIPAPPLSHCGASSQVPDSLPLYNGRRQNTWHGPLAPVGPQGMLTVSSYYCLSKRARSGFTWDQITHMCFCCAPFYLNGICQKLREGTTISLNWKNLGHTVETLATSSKRMGGECRLAATSHLPPGWSPRQQGKSTSGPGPSPLREASLRLPSLLPPRKGQLMRQRLDPLPQSLYT